MEKLLQNHGEKIRFIIVGGVNTALDFGILFFLTYLGMDKIIANYFSTGIALIFSFFANKSFTFKQQAGNAKKQFVYFLVITLFGLWVIQPVIIWGVTVALQSSVPSEGVRLLIAKLIATIASLIWNYILYSRIVFKKTQA
jgi:putative flippase GtrA